MAVVTHMKLANLEMNIIAGCNPYDLSRAPDKIFSKNSISFLAALSKVLLQEKNNRNYPDIISFAYWCRNANLKAIENSLNDERRIGRGLVLHIAPTNVPINFAFSLAFGLLSGNSNIVRVSENIHDQSEIVGKAIERLLSDSEHSKMRERIALVRYQRESKATATFSSVADARILWGGDQTIKEMRAIPTPARCVDVCFSDRYSFCTIDASSLERANQKSLNSLVLGFYNDVFLFDQNACSSPHLVIWQGTADEVSRARKKFWEHLELLIERKYEFQAIHAMDKFSLLCRSAIEIDGACVVDGGNNLLRRVFLSKVPENIDEFRGQFGLFYEISEEDLSCISHIVNDKYQTLTYYGVDPRELATYVKSLGLRGIDRIVPIGQALNIGIVWDGYDTVSMLSRVFEWH